MSDLQHRRLYRSVIDEVRGRRSANEREGRSGALHTANQKSTICGPAGSGLGRPITALICRPFVLSTAKKELGFNANRKASGLSGQWVPRRT